GDDHPRVVLGGLRHYSMIWSSDFLSCLVAAALRILRSALAVCPAFPITFPTSSGFTLRSMMMLVSLSTALTTTSSGLSTSALTTYSISSFRRGSSALVMVSGLLERDTAGAGEGGIAWNLPIDGGFRKKRR